MKLSKIYRHYSLVTLLIVLLLGTVSHYFIFRYAIQFSADHTLKAFKNNIEEYIAINDSLVVVDNPHLNNSIISVQEVPLSITLPEYFCDTLIYDDFKRELIVYRMCTFSLKGKNENYLISLAESTLDTEELIMASLFSLLTLFILFFLLYLLVNRWFIRMLWRPFYQILSQIEKIDLSSVILVHSPTKIDEFESLYEVVNRMLKKIQQDYQMMKEFSENAAHELQTPLAIAKAKVELLRDERLSSEQHQKILSIINSAIDRVIRLNRSILLITKIQNDQYPALSEMNITATLLHQLELYQDLIELKELRIKSEIKGDLTVKIHPFLAESMISNIINNAIRYSKSGGTIDIYCDIATIVVTNSYQNIIPKGDLFDRFTRSVEVRESTGLGLAIVKNICLKIGLNVSITFNEDYFTLTIQK